MWICDFATNWPCKSKIIARTLCVPWSTARMRSRMGWNLPGRAPLRLCGGAASMQPVNTGRPLRGWMLPECGAIVLQIRRQLHAQRVLDLGWLQHHPQHRRRPKVGDRERIADEIRAALPLLLDPVERRVHG